MTGRAPTPEGAAYHEQVVYGRAGGQDLTLQLYARECPGARRPAVVFIHGGGWVGGDPSMLARHAHGLAARGYVTALVSYRRHPAARWPDTLHDVKCAVRWLRANAHLIGADADRIAVSGNSAGGHMAALVALTPGREEGDGGHAEVSSAAQAMILWYPVVDLARMTLPTTEERAMVEEFFGGPLTTVAPEASPLHVVGPAPPPALILTGDADATTPLDSIEAFRDALAAAGGEVELVVYPGREHAFDLQPGDGEPSLEAAAGFLTRLWPMP